MDLKNMLIAALGLLPLECTAAASSLSTKGSGNIAQVCPGTRSARSATKTVHFNSAGWLIRSSLERTEFAGQERLHGVTELETGARLTEDATLDQTGALRSAEAVLCETDGSALKRVLFDRDRGTVEVSEASLHVEWDVPRDFPWIWAPLLAARSTGAPIATPLDARLAWRAAANGRMVRLLDLATLRSYSLASDQVLAPEQSGGTIVLGDDTSEVVNGMPTSLELKALHTQLVRVPATSSAADALLTVADRLPARASFAQ
jgi:hypothetical protein